MRVLDGSLRPANQFAIVPNTTHYTLAVEPMLRRSSSASWEPHRRQFGRGEARNLSGRPKTTSHGGRSRQGDGKS